MSAHFEITGVADWLDGDAMVGRVHKVESMRAGRPRFHSWSLRDDDGETYLSGTVWCDDGRDCDTLMNRVYAYYLADLGTTELFEDGDMVIG